MKNLYGIVIALVAEAFKHRTDKQGEPCFLHCMTVANSVSKKNRIRAMLHDFVEDIFPDNHELGFEALKQAGVPEDDIRVIRILTHNKNEDYLTVYVKRIALDADATEIKLADLEHNSNITRIKNALSKAHFDNIQKYHTAYQYLSKI
jgi:(p)ppGpp synthase/HD superfamily hydrolase